MGSSKKRAKVDDADDGDYAEGQKSPTAKRRRTGKRDPWSDEEALFGPKSKLLGVDLKVCFLLKRMFLLLTLLRATSRIRWLGNV